MTEREQPYQPYQPPSAPLVTPSERRLYSPKQVAAAAFLGSPIAGCWLMASNYAAVGNLGARRLTLIWGALSTVALAALTLVLPENVPNSVIPLTYTFAIYHLAKTYQGEAFAAHLASGGLRHSSWRVAGVGLAFLLAVFAVLIGIIMLLPEGLLPA